MHIFKHHFHICTCETLLKRLHPDVCRGLRRLNSSALWKRCDSKWNQKHKAEARFPGKCALRGFKCVAQQSEGVMGSTPFTEAGL